MAQDMERFAFKSGGILGVIAGALTAFLLKGCITNPIPNNTDVQSGYIAPANIEVLVQDADFNGELETIMKVDDKPYLLMQDGIDGSPVLRRYEIRPEGQYKVGEHLEIYQEAEK